MLILVKECGKSKTSWFWNTESGNYVKREAGKVQTLTPIEFLDDVVNYLDSNRCDGLQKWIEAGRPR